MVTFRNRRTPSGNCALIPANTEAVRGCKPGIGNDSERPSLLASGGRSTVGRKSSYRAMFRRSSGPLSGVKTSKPKHGRLSASKGTREAYSSRVITQPAPLPGQASPMRRISGGAAVVVRGWESQPHGEGRQDVSCWTTEGFFNREGSR
jgi:hypothetical protein